MYRDYSGKVVDAEELKRRKEAEAAAKKPKTEAPEWGGGLKQVCTPLGNLYIRPHMRRDGACR